MLNTALQSTSLRKMLRLYLFLLLMGPIIIFVYAWISSNWLHAADLGRTAMCRNFLAKDLTSERSFLAMRNLLNDRVEQQICLSNYYVIILVIIAGARLLASIVNLKVVKDFYISSFERSGAKIDFRMIVNFTIGGPIFGFFAMLIYFSHALTSAIQLTLVESVYFYETFRLFCFGAGLLALSEGILWIVWVLRFQPWDEATGI